MTLSSDSISISRGLCDMAVSDENLLTFQKGEGLYIPFSIWSFLSTFPIRTKKANNGVIVPEHIVCVLVHQALRGVWDAIDQGESGTQVSEQSGTTVREELGILVQHPKGLNPLLYTVTNSPCWGCICSIFMGDIWQDAFIWLPSSLDSLILHDSFRWPALEGAYLWWY